MTKYYWNSSKTEIYMWTMVNLFKSQDIWLQRLFSRFNQQCLFVSNLNVVFVTKS